MEADPYHSCLFLVAGAHTALETVSVPYLLLTAFLVFLNGFFVAAEFAIVKVRASQIDVRADLNKKLTNVAKSIVNNLDSYLAATQLGITLASLGLGWVGESSMTPLIIKTFELFGFTGDFNILGWSGNFTELAQKIAFPTAFAIITILHIVFGELAPKSIAIRYPSNTTFAVAWPLKIFHFVFKPIIVLMNGFANLLLRIVGIKAVHGSDIHSEEELKVIISESEEGGAIEHSEKELIQNVFEFDDRRVNNIQTLRKNVSALDVNSSVKEALDLVVEDGYSRFPVYEDSLDNVLGIVYTKDLIKQLLDDSDQKGIRDIMRQPEFVSESAKIKNVLKQLQQKRIQMAIVTNEVGEVSGLVTMEDILEELVGEIQDEYDDEEPVVEDKGNGIYLVNAHYTLSDINRYLPYRFEESEHYDTLAGLITEECPDVELKEGDAVDLKQYEAKVLKMYRNSPEKVLLKLKELQENDDKNSKKEEE